jgi:hypothetical protein
LSILEIVSKDEIKEKISSSSKIVQLFKEWMSSSKRNKVKKSSKKMKSHFPKICFQILKKLNKLDLLELCDRDYSDDSPDNLGNSLDISLNDLFKLLDEYALSLLLNNPTASDNDIDSLMSSTFDNYMDVRYYKILMQTIDWCDKLSSIDLDDYSTENMQQLANVLEQIPGPVGDLFGVVSAYLFSSC